MAFDPTDYDAFLALWRTLFPKSYTVPIETEGDGQGLDVYAQQAAQFARLSDALNTTTQAYYLRPHSTQTAPESAGARRATGSVEVSRAAPATGAITLSQGTQFVADVRSPDGSILDGIFVEATEDVLLPAGTLGPYSVPVRAVRPGYQGNVPAGSIVRFALRGRATIVGATVEVGNVLRDTGVPDRLTQAMVGQYVRLVGGANGGTVPRRILSVTQGATSFAVLDGAPLVAPDTLTQAEVEEFGDLGLTVSQASALSGGRHGFLDAIAADRNTGRQPGESDEQLRARLVALDDVVSPAAIRRAASRVLSPLGIAFDLRETRDPGGLFGFVYDLHPYDAFDLFSNASPVYVDEPSSVTFFVLLVAFGSQGEFGFAFDAPYPRNAYDATTANALNFYDGSPRLYLAALASLYDAINRARAAGVGWVLARDPNL